MPAAGPLPAGVLRACVPSPGKQGASLGQGTQMTWEEGRLPLSWAFLPGTFFASLGCPGSVRASRPTCASAAPAPRMARTCTSLLRAAPAPILREPCSSCRGPGSRSRLTDQPLFPASQVLLPPCVPKNETWSEKEPSRDFRCQHVAPWRTDDLKPKEPVEKAPSP